MKRQEAGKPKNYKIAARLRKAQACANLRWSGEELRQVRDAVAAGCDLHQVCAMLSYRTRDSVKDQFYRFKAPKHEPPPCLSDARRRKDAIEGSEMLLERLMEVHPEFFVRRATA